MKQLFLFILALVVMFSSCAEDETEGFDVIMPENNISFTPIAGGAMMHYKLPDNDNVFKIKVEYINALGQNVVRTGSYVQDTLELPGFKEAQKDVKARISLINRSEAISKSIDATFNTLDSGPVEFLKSVSVIPGWDGFQISYKLSDYAKGLAHIFYIGISPETKQLDTIPLQSFYFKGGENNIQFALKQKNDVNTVVIRTEDIKGYIAGQKLWKDVKTLSAVLIDPKDFGFYDVAHKSIENENAKLGWKYLFDGDNKGKNNLGLSTQHDYYYTFLAGPDAKNKPFIIDMQKEYNLAKIQIYGMLATRKFWPLRYYGGPFFNVYGEIWQGRYYNKLPSSVTIYVSNDKDDENSWIEYGSFNQDSKLQKEYRWCAKCSTIEEMNEVVLQSEEEVDASPASMIRINFPISEKSYRYLKIIVNDIFELWGYGWANDGQYVTFHEVEIYQKK